MLTTCFLKYEFLLSLMYFILVNYHSSVMILLRMSKISKNVQCGKSMWSKGRRRLINYS